MSSGFTADEEDLYFDTVEAVQRRLRKTRNPADLLAVIREAFKGFERAFASAPVAARAAVACRAGCGTCCHNEVAVQAHEVLIAAEYVQTHFSPADLEALVARAAAHRTAYAARLVDPAWVWPKTPCVLLREGSCSIYEGRPGICRAYHSNSLAGCITNLAAGHEQVDVKIRGLRGRMFAVMLGIDQAAEAAGFDEHAYDLGSALHEALTNSQCAIRWMRREPAFPADCREDMDGHAPA
ncbi:MAG: YkgJ family cysteine cluster protein [Opitutae bacterium]|nr:YkgJ family cysteine cluster protein [Opitutae bacterium]